jgi:small conductance mechanosensitive channel
MVVLQLLWCGLLADFVTGAFLIELRLFKVGDFVAVQGLREP